MMSWLFGSGWTTSQNPFGDRELGCLALAWERPPSKQVSKEKFALSREPVLDAIAWWAITGLPKLVSAVRYLLAGDMFLLWSHRSGLLRFQGRLNLVSSPQRKEQD